MRFLSDVHARADFVALLQKLDHDVIAVQQLGLELEPDERLVAEARERSRILLSFDNFRGETGGLVAIELHERGGKVIQFGGGPQQPPERAVGRFLFHQRDWQPFFESNDGLAYLSDLRGTCSMHPREDIQAILNKAQRRLFEEYLAARSGARATPRPRRRLPPRPEQPNLPIKDDA